MGKLSCPTSVRLATPADMAALYWHLMVDAQEDNGLWDPSPKKVLAHVKAACMGDRAVAGLIFEDGDLVGSTGIFLAQPWMSEAFFLSETWLFVREDARGGTNYGNDLADFAAWHREDMEERTGQKFILQKAIVTRKRLAAKTRLWKRRAEHIGSVFWIGA